MNFQFPKKWLDELKTPSVVLYLVTMIWFAHHLHAVVHLVLGPWLKYWIRTITQRISPVRHSPYSPIESFSTGKQVRNWVPIHLKVAPGHFQTVTTDRCICRNRQALAECLLDIAELVQNGLKTGGTDQAKRAELHEYVTFIYGSATSPYS